MKTRILNILATLMLAVTPTLAHSDHEVGPNGGRILEFSTNQTLHGKVTLTNGTFYVAILDKNMKPVSLKDQTLVVTGGSRSNPEKPPIEKRADHFVFPPLKGDSYLLVFQFKDKPASTAVIARFEYDAAICGSCKKGEWLCACGKKKN